MGSTFVFCVLFQNNIAAQVYQVVVTAHSEEAMQAGMEYFRADCFFGVHSWIHSLWEDSWKSLCLRGIGAQIWKRGCCSKLKGIFPSTDVRKYA